MKYIQSKTAFISLCLVVAMSANAQRMDTTVMTTNAELKYKEYMQKRSANLTIGWALVGTGVGLASAWYITNSSNGWNGTNKSEGMFEAGIVTAVLSTPFFVMAGANKRKARLALKGERLTSAIYFRRTTYPALSLTICL